jgi:hypothetical protein
MATYTQSILVYDPKEKEMDDDDREKAERLAKVGEHLNNAMQQRKDEGDEETVDDNENTENIDSIYEVRAAIDAMKDGDLFVCQTSSQCEHIGGGCECDSDVSTQIKNVQFGENTNCSVNITFFPSTPIKLEESGKKKSSSAKKIKQERQKMLKTTSFRFYTLHKETNEETAILDLRREFDGSEYIYFHKSGMCIDLLDKTKITDDLVDIKFNYMLYSIEL